MLFITYLPYCIYIKYLWRDLRVTLWRKGASLWGSLQCSELSLVNKFPIKMRKTLGPQEPGGRGQEQRGTWEMSLVIGGFWIGSPVWMFWHLDL